METKLQLFNSSKIRTAWNANEEEWYFSVVDVIAVLTDSVQPRKYWNDLKKKLTAMGSELSEKIGQLKMLSSDGKNYKTDVLKTEDLLRLIQSIPSPKAEPFKLWLAQVGSERLDEIADPEKAFERGVEYYRAKGYPEEWITQRMMSIKVRKKLTDEWKERGIDNSKDYAILTNDMTKAWSGKTVKEYKEFKGLKKEGLRDNMTDIELVLNMLAEVTTTNLSQKEKPETFEENREVAKRGGSVARNARADYEITTGEKAVSPLNAQTKELLDKTNRKPEIES